MLGFRKSFAICLFIAAVISFGMRNVWIGIQIVIVYAIVIIIWQVLTK